MFLNVKIVYFNVKKVHFIDFHAFHRKNTIKTMAKRCVFYFRIKVIVCEIC